MQTGPEQQQVSQHESREDERQDTSQPQVRNAWWLGRVDTTTIEDFRARSVVWVACGVGEDTDAAPGLAEFEHDMTIGDVLVIEDADSGRLLIGNIESEPLRRPGSTCLVSLRSVEWTASVESLPDQGQGQGQGQGQEPDADQEASADPLSPSPGLVRLPEALATLLHAAAVPLPPSEPVELRIDTSPLPIALPDMPGLYQSPYAERILRDFRWREYLVANPDVAATGEGEAHAFRHFFHQGYYERRIFDPKRLHGFDPGFYRERYPELGLDDDGLAQIHYCYQGWYEQRIPNRDSAWLYDAALHVYQMGKVGSHTIAEALQAAGYEGGVVHLHWPSDVVTGYPSNRLPYSRILVHERATPVKVISGAREIVSWTLSGLFQYHGAATINPDDARRLVEERFWHTCLNGLRWFDHRYHCDLDVYAHPFEHADGCARIAHEGIDLFLYRQEDMSRLETRFAGFLDLPQFSLGHRNVGEDKGYSGFYRSVLREFRLPGNLLSTLYDTPFMRHFYSDQEREVAYARWVRRG